MTQQKWEYKECKAEHTLFIESTHQRLGPHAMVRYLVKVGVEDTLHYNPYEEELQNVETFTILDEKAEVNPEWSDQYVNAEILLPREEKIARGQVVSQVQEANGNPIG